MHGVNQYPNSSRLMPSNTPLNNTALILALWKNYLQDLMDQVEEQYAHGATVDQVRQNIDLSKHFGLIDRLTDRSVSAHVEKAYREISWEP